jgi:hypothetical protein
MAIRALVQMKHRKLRIAWSVAWGIVAVLLVALWVRSCWKSDDLYIPLLGSWSIGVGSGPGSCGMGFSTGSIGNFHWSTTDVDQIRSLAPPEYAKYYSGIWGRFGYEKAVSPVVIAPDWFLISVAVALSAAPWVKRSNQFSLRTLLIATTLVAVGLGLVVWRAK